MIQMRRCLFRGRIAMNKIDCVIIGGGSAGLAAAIECKKLGIDQILVLEKEKEAGGILQQCIHNGFGLQQFKEELTGPSYAQRFIDEAKQLKIDIRFHTTVLDIDSNKKITYSNASEGLVTVQAKAIIFATGCKERTAGNINLKGKRIAGIWTAGTAQYYMNIEGLLVGKRIFILGSGDIGLIMARRLSLEGANVIGVAEIMPYSNGLTRNIVQCLHDFDIPLFLSHTVVDVQGESRVNRVVIAQVDEQFKPIENTEKSFDVDTLLLSVGLIPENDLMEKAGIVLDPKTQGPIVNESYQCNIPGFFACGNALLVHDLVDHVSEQGKHAGRFAARFIKSHQQASSNVKINYQGAIRFIVPQEISNEVNDQVMCYFRVDRIMKKAKISIYYQGNKIDEQVRNHLAPAEMGQITLKKDVISHCKSSITVEVLPYE